MLEALDNDSLLVSDRAVLDVLWLDALLLDALVSEMKVLEVDEVLLGELEPEDRLLEVLLLVELALDGLLLDVLLGEELFEEEVLEEDVLEKLEILEKLERLLKEELDELNSKLLVLSSLWDDEEELVPAETFVSSNPFDKRLQTSPRNPLLGIPYAMKSFSQLETFEFYIRSTGNRSIFGILHNKSHLESRLQTRRLRTHFDSRATKCRSTR